MKKLFVILAFIGVINATAFNSSARLPNPKKKTVIVDSTDILTPVTAQFTQLDGNLFLAIKVAGQIEAEDGDIIEFIFNNNDKLVSFHINDSNQELIDTGKANLFVMVHHDLALALKSTRLKEINFIQKNQSVLIQVDSFWVPSHNIHNLK